MHLLGAWRVSCQLGGPVRDRHRTEDVIVTTKWAGTGEEITQSFGGLTCAGAPIFLATASGATIRRSAARIGRSGLVQIFVITGTNGPLQRIAALASSEARTMGDRVGAPHLGSSAACASPPSDLHEANEHGRRGGVGGRGWPGDRPAHARRGTHPRKYPPSRHLTPPLRGRELTGLTS